MGDSEGEGGHKHEEEFYPGWVEFPHNMQRLWEDQHVIRKDVPLVSAWRQNFRQTQGIRRWFPEEEHLEKLTDFHKEHGAWPSAEGPESAATETAATETAATETAATETVATEAAATETAATEATSATSAVTRATPYTDDMAQMVADMEANGLLPEASTASTEASSATKAVSIATREPTGEMAEMVENIQRAEQQMAAERAAASTTGAVTSEAGALEAAGSEAGAIEAASSEAGAAAATTEGLSGMAIAGRAMGGLGAVGGVLEGAKGISELAHGEYQQGTLDVAAGGLGTAAGIAALAGASCPPLAIAAAATGMLALGNEKGKEWGLFGQHRNEKTGKMENRTAFDAAFETGDAAGEAVKGWFGDDHPILGSIVGGAAEGLTDVALGIGAGIADIGLGVVGAVEGIGKGIGSAVSAVLSW